MTERKTPRANNAPREYKKVLIGGQYYLADGSGRYYDVNTKQLALENKLDEKGRITYVRPGGQQQPPNNEKKDKK